VRIAAPEPEFETVPPRAHNRRCVLGADIASFVDPHNVVAWGALSVMSLVVLGASAATWKYYPDENGNRENVPLVPLGACSLVVFLVQLVAIITIEIK